MINTGDFCLIWRSGHIVGAGIADTIRGFAQDHIRINGMDFHRVSGRCDTYKAVVVTNAEYMQHIDAEKAANDRREQEEQMAQIAKEKEAEAWFNTLTPEQQEHVRVLTWAWMPIAVA